MIFYIILPINNFINISHLRKKNYPGKIVQTYICVQMKMHMSNKCVNVFHFINQLNIDFESKNLVVD